MVLHTLADVNSMLQLRCTCKWLVQESGHLTFFYQVIPGSVYLRSIL